MPEDRLVQLRTKYQSVIDRMTELGVRLEDLRVQENKLVLRARARTRADADQVWNEIKRIDPLYAADLAAQIGSDGDVSTPPPIPPPRAPRTHTVRQGETLTGIAVQIYGDASKYHKILEANRDQIVDADRIKPGQVLRLPS
jgi:nucleoid-associated protein YgaU